MTTLLVLVGTAVVGLVALVGLFLGGMRAKWPPVVDTVRRINLRVLNPRQMVTAGQPGAYAGILRHTGRTSGTAYETPLGIERTDDGFAIALVYGARTQWLRNVLAAGRAEVVKDGSTYQVEHPEVVPISDLAAWFSSSDQRMASVFGTTECLRLRVAAPLDGRPALESAHA
jgi:deazaflavin-dependent oxidoreductase (nitroreductase family)